VIFAKNSSKKGRLTAKKVKVYGNLSVPGTLRYSMRIGWGERERGMVRRYYGLTAAPDGSR
jgi:hypothetical protein